MKILIGIICALVLLGMTPAAYADDTEGAAPSLRFDDFKTYVEGTQFNVSLPFKGDFSAADIEASFLGDAVQIDIPGANFPKGKHLLRTNGKVVKSVYVSQPDAQTVRLRVTLNPGYRGSELGDSLKVSRTDGRFNLSFDAAIEKASATAGEATSQKLSFDDASSTNPAAKEAMKDEIIEQARLVARDADVHPETPVEKGSEATPIPDEKVTVATAPVTAEATKKLAESEIPLAVEKEVKKSEAPPWQRIAITIGVMTMMGIGASVGMKKWSQTARGRVAKNARIKVLTQHHLGPKKQLMIVEVAGESMLIGVTDQNITMLKSLSLIDDEIPDGLPRSFEGAIEDNFIETQNQVKPRLSVSASEPRAQRALASATEADTEQENFALNGLAEIRDKVSTRLKNMRTL